MPIQRVFIIWSHPLFHESVRLLLDHPDIEFVGTTSDYKTAHEEILSLQPDTIIVEEEEGGLPNEKMKYLESYPWKVRITFLNLTDNQLHMYQHEQRTIGQAEDLLRLILSETT
jgi:DNA-binding NarL/FixJ family response regulator